MLKGATLKSPGRLELGYERKQLVSNDSRVFYQATRVAINRYGEEQGLKWFEGKMAVHFSFNILLIHF